MFGWLANTEYSAWVRESWGWPFALTLHAFGNAAVVGLIFIIAMRLLGLFRTIPYTSLHRLMPFLWTGFVCQVASGYTLWSSKPDRYLADAMFDVKFSFVILGAILTWYFQGSPQARGDRLAGNGHGLFAWGPTCLRCSTGMGCCSDDRATDCVLGNIVHAIDHCRMCRRRHGVKCAG